MSQPGPQKYFRQLVYYIISLIISLNSFCEDQYIIIIVIKSSLYKEASELVQNISDELYILHDLLNCGIKCVEDCINSTFLRSVLQNVCYPAILNSLSTFPPILTHVSFSLSYSYSLVFNPSRSSFVYSSFNHSIQSYYILSISFILIYSFISTVQFMIQSNFSYSKIHVHFNLILFLLQFILQIKENQFNYNLFLNLFNYYLFLFHSFLFYLLYSLLP